MEGEEWEGSFFLETKDCSIYIVFILNVIFELVGVIFFVASEVTGSSGKAQMD